MAVGDIYRLSVQTVIESSVASWNAHYEELDPASTDGDGDLLAEGWAATNTVAFKALLSTTVRFASVRAWRVGTPGFPGLHVVPDPNIGTVGGDSIPANKALVFKLVQFAGAARFNGRIYISGLSEGSVDSNSITSAFQSGAVATFITALLADVDAVAPGAGRWRIVVLSKKFTPPTFSFGSPLDVALINVNPVIATQRRRSPKAIQINRP